MHLYFTHYNFINIYILKILKFRERIFKEYLDIYIYSLIILYKKLIIVYYIKNI